MIPAIRKLTQEDLESQDNLGNIVRPCTGTTTNENLQTERILLCIAQNNYFSQVLERWFSG